MIVGTKLRMIKPISSIPAGTDVIVTEIHDDYMVVENSYGKGIMSITGWDEYFEKISVIVKPKRKVQ